VKRAGAALAVLLLAGCAGARAGPRGPVVSPTGIVYPLGTPPFETQYSQTATLHLRRSDPVRALELAREGMAADSANPIHYFLAGVASARLGLYQQADALFDEAQRIYPAYELDVEPERVSAWAEAFNRGLEAYADGMDERAIEVWRGATVMYRMRPEAHRNLASLLRQEGRFEEAVQLYGDLLVGLQELPATRVLDEGELAERAAARVDAEASLTELLLIDGRWVEVEPLLRARLSREPENRQLRQDLASALLGQGRQDEARTIYEGLLAGSELGAADLHNLGVALFTAGAPQRAAEAFGRLVEHRPSSRDAWFNYANALMAAGDWTGVVAAGDRLLSLDPLGERSALMVARGHLETGDQQRALARLERIDGAPVHLEGLALRVAGSVARFEAQVVGNVAPAGSVLTLRFTFSDDEGKETSVEHRVVAPATGEHAPLNVSATLRATGYRYELLPTTPEPGS
jgi:tetratricopeptide (TPR) repeat protein